MPRTVPGAIAAKTGSGALFFVWLVELRPVGGAALYLSSGKSVTYSGNVYTANRVKSVDGLTAPYIDYKNLTFGSASIILRGLSDDGSTTLPYVTLEGTINLEGARVFIHLYDVDAGVAVDALFQGYVKTRAYDGTEHTATLEASHLWDCPAIVIPSSTLQQEGFGTLDTNEVKESVIDETTLPLFWSASQVKIRPTIYHTRVRASVIQVNGIISGCGPVPFDPADIIATTIFDTTPAESISFSHRGLAIDNVTDDTTKYPDGLAHNNVAYFSARYPITDDNKGNLDNISADAVKLTMAKGRALIDTGLASGNGVLICKDGLRDPRFGVGMASTEFDDLTAAATLAGSLWQVRLELHEQQPVGDWVQKLLTQIHGFCTFNGRLLQIGIKNPSEASVATYATRRSGHGGLEISADAVKADFESADTLINQINIKYRLSNRHQKPMIVYDSNSQNRLGGTVRTVNPTSFEYDALYVADQVKISGAMWVREEQNENLRISFDTPLVEGLTPAPGDLITVWSEDIPNNATNNVFRVLGQTFGTGEIPKVSFQCRVYKASAHANSTAGIGVDLIRTGVDVSNQGRPPDVTPVSLTLLDKTAGDTEGVMGNFRAVFTYPVVDLATEQADGIFRQYPIRSVKLYCRFTDEAVGEYKLVKEVEWPVAQADFTFDFIKSKSIIVAFVAIGRDRSQGPLGYVVDSTKVNSLSAALSATSALASVFDSTLFTVGDYVITEFEVDRLLSKATGQLTFENVAGVRTPQLSTTAIAHPIKTQVAVAKLNYPTLQISLNPPRFTYPTVAARDILQRGGDGVRVRWTDVSPENLEQYLVYSSKDADAGTNVAKLGSATPAWYVADPLVPPSGVTLSIASNQKSFLIPQEDIGPVGTLVFARIAAKNGKRNFSAALSGLLNSSVASGGTSPPTDVLGNVDIISNTYEQTPEGLRAKVIWRVYADLTLVKTFGDTGCTSVGLVFQLTSSGGGKYRPLFPVEDPTVVFLDCITYFPLGETVTIIKGVAWNSGGKKVSTYNFTFFAGGQTSLAGITGFSIIAITSIDEKHSYLLFGYTQPATPVVISHALILRQLAGEVSFSKEHKIPLLNEAGNLTAGAKTITDVVKHPKKNAVQWKIRLISVDGTTLDSAVFNNTSPDVDTAAPNNGVPVVINRAKLKKGAKLIVDFVLPTVQMVSHSKNVLVIHDNNSTGGGRKFFDPYTSAWVATYPDGTTELSFAKGGIPSLPISPSEIYVGGRTQFFIRVGVYNLFNGSSFTYSGDVTTAITQAGSEAEGPAADIAVPSALAVPVLSWQAKAFHLAGMTVGAGWNQPYKKYIVLYDGGSGYFNLPGYFAATQSVGVTTELAARYEIGPGKDHVTLGIRLKDLKNALGSGATIKAYFYAENLGTSPAISSPSGLSNGIVLANAKDIISDRDAVNVVDVGTTMISNGQILFNGDNLYGDKAGAGVVNNHKLSSGASFAAIGAGFTGGSGITSTNPATDKVHWLQIDHAIRWNDNLTGIFFPLKQRILPGEILTFSFLAQSPNLITADLTIGLRDVTGVNCTVVQAPVTLNGLTTSYFVYACTIQRASFSVAFNEFLEIRTTTPLKAQTAGANDYIVLDKFMLVRGKQPAAYSARTSSYEVGFGTTGANGTENPDIVANTSTAIPPDLGYSSGIQGGAFVKDTGGRLDLKTLL